MKKLCDRLDEVETNNFDLEQQLDELAVIRAELIPRLRDDLEAKMLVLPPPESSHIITFPSPTCLLGHK